MQPQTVDSTANLALCRWCVFRPGDFKGRPPADDLPDTTFVDLKRIYDWVVETKGYKPAVVAAEDLLDNPGGTGTQRVNSSCNARCT